MADPAVASAGEGAAAMVCDDAADLALPPAGAEELGYHPGMTCDRSGVSPIVGIRYNLRGEDFDLCQAEFDKLPEVERLNYEAISAPVKPTRVAPLAVAADASEGAGGDAATANDEDAVLAKIARERKKLAAHEDFKHGGRADPLGETSTAAGREDAPSREMRFSAVLYDNFAIPPASVMTWPAGLQGADSRAMSADCEALPGPAGREEEHVLGFPLRRLLRLVQVVHEWVHVQRSGRIDWEAIARKMSARQPGTLRTPSLLPTSSPRLLPPRLLATLARAS